MRMRVLLVGLFYDGVVIVVIVVVVVIIICDLQTLRKRLFVPILRRVLWRNIVLRQLFAILRLELVFVTHRRRTRRPRVGPFLRVLRVTESTLRIHTETSR